MKLKTTKFILLSLIVLICGFVIMKLLTQASVWTYAAIGCLVLYVIIMVRFWRCPKCGGNLGRITDLNSHTVCCQACGEKIEL